MFSVVIPYYNKSKYILRCIDSVWQQTYKNFEIILVNDGATDDGIDLVLTKYGNTVTVINQPNSGVSTARNTGIKASKYSFIAFLDADDCWHSRYLETVNSIVSKQEKLTIIGAHYSRTSDFLANEPDTIDYFKFGNYFKLAIKNTYFTASSTCIARNFFEKNSGFNPNLKTGEDSDVWFRAVQNGNGAFYIKNTLSFYSDEDENQTTKTTVAIKNSLVGNINSIYKNDISNNENRDFDRFISLYVYFNLYSYYYDKQYYSEAKAVLKQNQFYFFGLHLMYYLPFRIGHTIVNSKKLNRYLRLYLKFVIKYFYS
ncbi:MAG: glycosyltransferase family A protein [Flavobacterium sp.]|nr:glycosyltransferase family A protein [Flavobacterium sp.]